VFHKSVVYAIKVTKYVHRSVEMNWKQGTGHHCGHKTCFGVEKRRCRGQVELRKFEGDVRMSVNGEIVEKTKKTTDVLVLLLVRFVAGFRLEERDRGSRGRLISP
jgi:hypothetical protein